MGFVEERDALTALAEEVGLRYIDLRETDLDLQALHGFPQKLIYRQSLFPIGYDGDSIVVATPPTHWISTRSTKRAQRPDETSFQSSPNAPKSRG